ncbi:MAG: hypothetical protein OQK79_10445 [Rhodanobacter sp.]|jgi:hypothetical protein|nr:hypothetical protein [Rhodanobacter sp.]
MVWLVSTCLITAAVLVLVCEVARHSERFGGLLAALLVRRAGLALP